MLADAERRARLASEEPDPEVRARVLALLARSTVGTGLDGQAVSGLLGAITADAPKTGSVLGAWTLIGVLGEGGMGTVFEAQRSDGHFQQTAALKVLKGLPSQAALAYLARERQILAGLTHPNIARLLDGGATPGGQPYFVMAMQDGLPIDQYCAERKLGSAAILRLMLPVCDAISYAHARLVIHCDLKPSNILVDTQGRPCVLDFGIARPLDEPLASSQPSSSSLRVRAFTPGFASPELEAGHAVTTATDVFSLGRLLECLLGDHRIDAELSALIRRACAFEPTDRYGSVADFRADLEARLDGQPLAAMPKTFSYGAKKWLRRHWQVVAAGLAFVVLASVFTIQTIRERDRARVAEQQAVLERDRARQAETSARQISDFLVSILDGANPDAGSGEVPTSKLVTQALARIDTELADQPAVQSELYATLASVLSVLGSDQLAHESIQKAIALTRTLDRPDQLVTQLQQLVALRLESFDARDAVAPAREVLSVLEGLKETTPKMLAEARQDLGSILSMQGDPEGFELLKQVAEAQRTLDPNGLGLMDALHAMAGYHLGKREFCRGRNAAARMPRTAIEVPAV
ncbi:MAG: serine/threonine protein kinase [Ahniella sp.]|nr:serine/threonine protein kinase [Ahniella sp.]